MDMEERRQETEKATRKAERSHEDKRLKVMMDMEERRQETEKATREAERSHEEKIMKIMFMMMNPGHQQMPMQHYQTPQMMNPSVVMPMNMSNITSSTPNSDMNNAPNMTTLLNMPHSSATTISCSNSVCILISRSEHNW